jgi:hypothetical protein
LEQQLFEMWDSFETLASMSETERRAAYECGGLESLNSFMGTALLTYGDPRIRDALGFSKFVLELRANYREWNQHLMTLMTVFDANRDSGPLIEFARSCHWRVLAAAATDLAAS